MRVFSPRSSGGICSNVHSCPASSDMFASVERSADSASANDSAIT